MDQTLASLGGKTTQVGAGTSLLSWATSSEAGFLIGVLIGIAGFAVQWYYTRERNRREKAEHEARMARYDARMEEREAERREMLGE